MSQSLLGAQTRPAQEGAKVGTLRTRSCALSGHYASHPFSHASNNLTQVEDHDAHALLRNHLLHLSMRAQVQVQRWHLCSRHSVCHCLPGGLYRSRLHIKGVYSATGAHCFCEESCVMAVATRGIHAHISLPKHLPPQVLGNVRQPGMLHQLLKPAGLVISSLLLLLAGLLRPLVD